MAGTELGVAYVSVVPETSKVASGVAAALKDAGKHGDTAGRDIGQRMATALGTHLNAGTKGVGAKAATTLTGEFVAGLKTGMGQANPAIMELGKSFTSVGTIAAVAAAGIVTAIAGIGTAAVAVGKQLYDLGSQFDDVSDSIAIKTGKVGAALEAITGSVDNVAQRTASSLGVIGDIAAQVTQSLHIEPGPLFENVTKQIADLNRMTKDPLNTREFARMTRQFNVAAQDIPKTLDQIFETATATGIPVNELITNLVKAGPAAKEMNLGLGETAALLLAFEASGVDSAAAITGLRKANAGFAKDGKESEQGLRDTVTQMKAFITSGQDMKALDLANTVFGARTGGLFFDAVKNGKIDLDQLQAGLQTTGTTIEQMSQATADWSEKWTIIKNKVAEALKPVATRIFDIANSGLDDLSKWVDAHQNDIIDMFTKASIAVVDFSVGFIQRIGMVLESTGMFMQGIGDMVGGILKADAALQRLIGRGEYADQLDREAEAWFGLGDATVDTARKMQSVNADDLKRKLKEIGDEAKTTSDNTSALGRALDGLPRKTDIALNIGMGINGVPMNPQDIQSILSGPLFGTAGQGGNLPAPSIGGGGRGFGANQGGLPPNSLFGGGGLNAPTGQTGGGNQAAVHQAMLAAGYPESEWPALQALINSESGFQTGVRNPSSGAYGIFQFLGHEGDKYGALGAYSADPAAQSRAGMAYIADRYGTPSAAWAFKQRNNWYDEGGWLPPGAQWIINATGQPELVLNEEQQKQLAAQGIDPKTLLHGTGKGAAPGPVPPSGKSNQPTPEDAALGDTLTRTLGFIPTAANTGGVAGTSFIAGLLNLGNEAVAGLIDTGASAAQQGISLAATVGGAMAGGGGAAAGPAAAAAAGIGIQIVANEAKRAVSYGFQLGAIGADALVAQLFPFGAPRWIGYDYTQFLPHLNISQIGTTTVEKAFEAAKQNGLIPGLGAQGPGQGKNLFGGDLGPVPGPAPGGPVNPEHLPGQQQSGPPVPQLGGKPSAPITAGPIPGQQPPGQWFTPGRTQAAPPPPAQPPKPTSPSPGQGAENDPFKLLKEGLFGSSFDEGGWLMPGQVGINYSARPEPVFSNAQWKAMEAQLTPADKKAAFGVYIENLHAADADDVKRQIDNQQRLAQMRFAGRPY